MPKEPKRNRVDDEAEESQPKRPAPKPAPAPAPETEPQDEEGGGVPHDPKDGNNPGPPKP